MTRTRRGLFDRLPIRHLDLVEIEKSALPKVLKLSEMQVIVSLGLDRASLGDENIDLLKGATLAALRWLSLAGNHLSLEGVRSLAISWKKFIPSLQFVDHGNRYDPGSEIDHDQHVALTWRRGGVAA